MDEADAAQTRMLDLVGTLWSRERMLTALALTDAELDEAALDRKLLRLTTSDGIDLYPLYQFTKTTTGEVVVRPAILAMLPEFHGRVRTAAEVAVHRPGSGR